MVRRSGVMGMAIILFVVFAISAQPPGGPGGFGGPGFGRLGGSPDSPLMLLRMSEVRKELGTSDGQNKQLDALLADVQKQTRAAFEKINFQELQELSQEERDKRFGQARKESDEANKKAEGKLGTILDAKQRARLNQLRLQREGVTAFNRPEVARQLGLTDDQKGKLRKLQEPGSRPFPRGPQEREKALADALAILTAEQKAKWQELKGKEFKFPQFPGGFMGPQQRQLIKQFDKDKDGRLNAAERQAARASIKKEREIGGRGGFGPPGGFGRENREPPKPGPRVTPADVQSYPNAGLYEPFVLRTFFLQFEDKDWEAELADFKNTDVEVPATLMVDGKKYPNVGVRFRGMSSFGGVRAGHKRSFNLSLDFVDTKQRLYGYKTLNLLNSHEDSSFLSTVLYSHIARQYIPAPKANFVKVVINGESWGVYVNAQQFNKEFVAENYQGGKGARWKVRGSPGGGGGLDYLGENIEDHKRRYQIKSKDDAKDWKTLVALCRILNQTPLDKLEEALKPILDLDGVLWFLALDNALINNDGYWVRASDYSIFRDRKGVFHLIPHDINEAFQGAMGFGFGPGPGGPGGSPQGARGARPRPPGAELDPLIGLDDSRKPLRSRLLAVPSLRARYLDHVRTIAERSLDWKNLGPIVARYRSLIEKEVEADTRKLSSYDAFQKAVAETIDLGAPQGRRPSLSLRAFAEKRRHYLLQHPEIKKAASGGEAEGSRKGKTKS